MFEPTLLFGLFAAVLGILAAGYYGRLELGAGMLALVGVILAQISVNMLDDYVDYSSGLDKETVKTKFSGGSQLVVGGNVNPEHVLVISLVLFVIALLIGTYLTIEDIALLPFFALGALCVVFYAKYMTKVPFLAEPACGLSFIFISLGCFLAAGGSLVIVPLLLFAAVPAGGQVGMALFVNGIPDRKVDSRFGRKNIGIMLKTNKNAAYFYLAMNIVAYLLVTIGVLANAIPKTSLLVLITVPIIWAISCSISKYKNHRSFEKVMGMATMTELAIMLLLAMAFV